jgi:hypothetical protein
LGLDGQPTQTIPVFRLPGLSTGAVVLETNLASAGQGDVMIQVQSLSDATRTAMATATVTATAAPDTTPPTSSVAALPPSSPATFTVSWSGSDGTGSGIATYDVFVSDNGSPFTMLRSGTTQTSASFTGQGGHTYGFYSVATDAAGNRQATPAAAQATTTVCGPDAAARPAVRFVQQVYCDLFDRALDAEGLARWPVLLDAGMTASQVVARILTSAPFLEYRRDQVNEVYARLLQRPAEPAGLARWVAFLQGGGTIEQLIARVAGSPEYFTRNGGNTDGFLAAIYRDLLGRAGDADGLARFRQRLAEGATRGQVAAAVLGSDEYRGKLVADLYEQYLHRQAGPAEVAARVAALRRGQRHEELVAAILGSAEYYRRAVSVGPERPPLDTATPYVTALYREVLNREPDPAGLAGWVHFLNRGGNREQVARAFWESVEHRGLQVDQFYATYLHHPADARGRAFWVGQLRAGVSEAEVARRFLLSAEYQATHATPAAFVGGLYTDVLGHAGSPGGVTFWVSQLTAGASRAQVAQAFLTSEEAYRRAVDEYYTDFLERQPDARGEQGWLAALVQRRLSLADVAQALLASEEFFARAASGRV